MSVGSFFLGLVMMVLGFFTIWKTDWFLRNFGDLGTMVGLEDKSWASWKTFGVIFMILGFLIAFGLLQLFFRLTIGRLFLFGGL